MNPVPAIAILEAAKPIRIQRMPETPEEAFQRLGIDRVRLMLQTGNLPGGQTAHALAWVAKHDQEERLRNDSSQSLQMRTARSAKTAAWIAAIAAIIAAILAAASIVVALK